MNANVRNRRTVELCVDGLLPLERGLWPRTFQMGSRIQTTKEAVRSLLPRKAVRSVPLVLVLLLLAGCEAQLGSGGPVLEDSDDVGPDAGVELAPDAAAPDASSIAADNACGVASMQGDLGTLSGEAGVDGTAPDRIFYISAQSSPTAMEAAPDLVLVELWDGFGAFAGGLAKTGTFQIAGDETDYDTCGVCVVMLANVADNTPTKMMIAAAGTVTVTSLATAAGQTTQVTVSNATFVEIAGSADGFVAVPDSTCSSPLANVVLSGKI